MNPETPSPENATPRIFSPISSAELALIPAAEAGSKQPPAAETVEDAAASATAPEEVVSPAPASVAASPEAVETAPESADPAENPQLAVSFSDVPDAAFQSSLALGLSCARENAQIRYALGASDVGEDGLIFSRKDKILLTQNTLVAARAFENGERGPLLTGKFEIKKPLWQEIEPADPTDATPHKWGESGQCEDGWKVSAGSVRGKLHAHRGQWREDCFGFSSAQNGADWWQIVAVSDGAGSAPLSRIGSRLACDASIRALQTSLAALPQFSTDKEQLAARDLPVLRAALVQAASAALEALRSQAQQRSQPLGAFAATLLILVRREWNGQQLCASVQVGDGVVALWSASSLTLLGVADHGQHSSETRFLTTRGIEAELASRVTFSIKDDLLAFAVLSDGVSDDYFPEERRLGEVFDAVLPLLQSQSDGAAALISWLEYEKKGSSDDRTLVVGWKDAAPIAVPIAVSGRETAREIPLETAKTEASDGDSDRDSG